MTGECLKYIKGLTVVLQKSAQDVSEVYQHVASIISVQKKSQDKVDTKHRDWYQLAESKVAAIEGGEPAIPRRCGRQTQQANVEGKAS